MSGPIFDVADLYGALMWAAAVPLFAVAFPPGTFSHDTVRVSRWRMLSIAVPLAVVVGALKIVGSAYRRGFDAAGLNGARVEFMILFGVIGSAFLIVTLIRRLRRLTRS